MPTIYPLGESSISISGGKQLSGITQGDGTHLAGETITLNFNNWEAVEINDTDADFEDSDNSQTLDGAQTFDGTLYAGGLRVEAEYSVTVTDLTDPSGTTYSLIGFNINEEGGGPSFATVEGLAFVGGIAGFPPIGVALTVISTQEGPSETFTDLASPPCFCSGTLIETPDGPIPVEQLAVGDLVLTMDHGAQPLRWLGCAEIPRTILERDPRFLPVLVRQDAFGSGRPNRDMRLSQQHRVLIDDWRAEVFFGLPEILVPIKKLANGSSVRIETASAKVTYFHLLFDRHEIIWSDGLASESFLPDSSRDDRLRHAPRGHAPVSRIT